MFDKLITDLFNCYGLVVYVSHASYCIHLHYNPTDTDTNNKLVGDLTKLLPCSMCDLRYFNLHKYPHDNMITLFFTNCMDPEVTEAVI